MIVLHIIYNQIYIYIINIHSIHCSIDIIISLLRPIPKPDILSKIMQSNDVKCMCKYLIIYTCKLIHHVPCVVAHVHCSTANRPP